MSNVIHQGSAGKTGYSDFEIVADSKRNRKQWLKARDTGIGASEAAVLFGVNPWQSPWSLYQMKRGEVEAQPDNPAMEWGLRLEPVIAKAFSEKTGRTVWEHPLGGMLLRSKKYPWLLATPDYEQYAKRFAGDGLLEIKTTGAQNADAWSEGVPLIHQIQVTQQLLVTGRKYASVACLIGGQKFVHASVARNPAFIKNLIERTRVFWQMVQDGTPPPIDASESTVETLKKMREDKNVITLPANILRWHDQMLAAAERRKLAEQEEEEAKREISALMGTAKRGLLPNGCGMYRFETRKAYTVKSHNVGASRLLKFSLRTDV